MSKNTNLSFLTDYITADITNGRIGINNASPTVAFDVVGATKITGVLTLTSTISNGTYAYTLPSATGTLALTSALSSYLPLTGGTLTGALSGTSASFSSTVIATGYVEGSFFQTGAIPATSGGVRLGTQVAIRARNVANTANIPLIESSATDKVSIDSGGAGTVLGGALVGTSATFSSRVNVNGGADDADIAMTIKASSGSGKFILFGRDSSGGATSKISAEGAATFSSSVTIGSTLSNSLSVGLTQPTTDTLNQIFAGQGVFGGQASAGGETDIGNNWYYYSGWKYRFTASSSNIKLNGNVISFERAASGTANAAISFVESMRIPSTGGLLIGTTTGTGLTTGSSVNVGVEISGGIIALQVNNNSNQYWSKASGYTSGDFTAHFVNGTYVGGISTNGSTTNYATASDYRLKEDLKDFVGIDLINRIKTYDYQWKSDKTRMYGVVAHEFAEILSYAVTGQKDEERMQGVDYSKIVPVLVKAIQELSAEITILKNK